MYVEMPNSNHGKTVMEMRGYENLQQVKDRVHGKLWRKVKIYELFPDKEPRRLLKKELLELGAVDD